MNALSCRPMKINAKRREAGGHSSHILECNLRYGDAAWVADFQNDRRVCPKILKGSFAIRKGSVFRVDSFSRLSTIVYKLHGPGDECQRLSYGGDTAAAHTIHSRRRRPLIRLLRVYATLTYPNTSRIPITRKNSPCGHLKSNRVNAESPVRTLHVSLQLCALWRGNVALMLVGLERGKKLQVRPPQSPRSPTHTRLHHRGSKLDPRLDLRSTQRTVTPIEFRAELESEMMFIPNLRNWRFEISTREQQASRVAGSWLARSSRGRDKKKKKKNQRLWYVAAYCRVVIAAYSLRHRLCSLPSVISMNLPEYRRDNHGVRVCDNTLERFSEILDLHSAVSGPQTKDEVDRSRWLHTTNLRVPTSNCFSADTTSENGVLKSNNYSNRLLEHSINEINKRSHGRKGRERRSTEEPMAIREEGPECETRTRIQFDLGSNVKVLHQRNFMILDLRFVPLGCKEIRWRICAVFNRLILLKCVLDASPAAAFCNSLAVTQRSVKSLNDKDPELYTTGAVDVNKLQNTAAGLDTDVSMQFARLVRLYWIVNKGCSLQPDSKHPNRWRPASECRTVGRGPIGKHLKKQLRTYEKKGGDHWADDVNLRLHLAVSDLHGGETGEPRENPLTSGFIVRHNSHLRKSGSGLAGDWTRNKLQLINPVLSNPICQQLQRGRTMSDYSKMPEVTGSKDIPVEITNNKFKDLKIIPDDTDALVFCIQHYHFQQLEWTGLMKSTHSQRVYIDTSMAESQNKVVAPYVLVAHALSGCDTPPVLYGWRLGWRLYFRLKLLTCRRPGSLSKSRRRNMTAMDNEEVTLLLYAEDSDGNATGVRISTGSVPFGTILVSAFTTKWNVAYAGLLGKCKAVPFSSQLMERGGQATPASNRPDIVRMAPGWTPRSKRLVKEGWRVGGGVVVEDPREKPRKPAASSPCKIPTCENPGATPPECSSRYATAAPGESNFRQSFSSLLTEDLPTMAVSPWAICLSARGRDP
ncbi:hypothetical protein PR048_033365 [Dryococelus australis]|uniref:Uncharacterized protein n=1 Tax=Dryococelus australis TaxID=614101 RepID=A0ABQ9G3F3_9NEOP|nr:hypothetical protein PR048_033365 [Dryococelus australis]